jgi:SAM-dependent methyltransferase
MALDRVRNDAYARALAAVVTRDSVVLDLGAGTGIHGLIAARLGAKRVYLVEPEDIFAVAQEVVRENGLEDVVRCLQGRVEDLELDEPVDVIVSAVTGNVLMGEDLLPVLFRARDRWLRPEGVLIPSAATVFVVPVSAPALYGRELEGWSAAQHGVTMRAARTYAANSLHYRWPRGEVRYLATPLPVHTVDLTRDAYDGIHAEVTFEIRGDEAPQRHAGDGVCHGFAAWFDMRLGDRCLSTGPHAPAVHWSPAFLPLDAPVVSKQNDVVSLRIDRPPFGEWTWRTSWNGVSQRHSTLLSAPATLGTVRKAALDYRPSLAPSGEAAQFVLSRCRAIETVAQIASALRAHAPKRYRDDGEALRFVQSIVKGFA